MLKKDSDEFKILKQIHPTPAVGGLPKNLAKDYIKEHPEDKWMYKSHHDVITIEGLRFASTNDFS